jgi:hypothetical protein
MSNVLPWPTGTVAVFEAPWMARPREELSHRTTVVNVLAVAGRLKAAAPEVQLETPFGRDVRWLMRVPVSFASESVPFGL